MHEQNFIRRFALTEPATPLPNAHQGGAFLYMFANFSDTKLKKKIARSYGIPQHEILESWTAAIGPLRNCCAHHGRLWNRKFPITPLLPSRMRKQWIADLNISNNKLYAVLCCVAYMLNTIDANNTFASEQTCPFGIEETDETFKSISLAKLNEMTRKLASGYTSFWS